MVKKQLKAQVSKHDPHSPEDKAAASPPEPAAVDRLGFDLGGSSSVRTSLTKETQTPRIPIGGLQMHHMTHMDENMKSCIETCNECRDECETTLYQHCLEQGGKHVEQAHVKLMADCIEICQTATHFMLRGSDQHKAVCGTCADSCEACAESCEKIGGEEMKNCAEACRKCAKTCREMSGTKSQNTGRSKKAA